MLLQALYSIRSERQLMERLEYDLLFRWFVEIGVDAAVWDHSVFSKNRDRLLEGNIAARFLAAVLDQPRVKKLLSTEHFTVDGTLIEAWASLKSFKPRDGSDEPPASGGRLRHPFPGKSGRTRPMSRRRIQMHGSTARDRARRPSSDSSAMLDGERHGLVVDACLTPADGHAERVAALAMMNASRRSERDHSVPTGLLRGRLSDCSTR